MKRVFIVIGVYLSVAVFLGTYFAVYASVNHLTSHPAFAVNFAPLIALVPSLACVWYLWHLWRAISELQNKPLAN